MPLHQIIQSRTLTALCMDVQVLPEVEPASDSTKTSDPTFAIIDTAEPALVADPFLKGFDPTIEYLNTLFLIDPHDPKMLEMADLDL